uniref:DUF19 domain-containing protein n=1 Tax=Panagrolaimus davidi TaxID=227884 RepID=A0A914R5J1_9BILA
MFLRLFVFCFFLCSVSTVISFRTPCADQTQRCGVLIEEFEKKVQDLKALAFRRCFSHPACMQEKIAFDDCYSKAIRAVRAPFNGETTPNDSFFDSSERFRAQVEACLGSPDEQPFGYSGNEFSEQNSIFEPIVFSTELADRMWSLPETREGFSKLCQKRDYGRLFGDGISRILDTSKPAINNLNTSCILRQNEIECYEKALENDEKFQQTIKNRDQTLQGCIQSIRLQSHCRGNDSGHSKECLCNAREEFDNRLQASLLECTRKSDIGKLYAELLEKGIDQKNLSPTNDDAEVIGAETITEDLKEDETTSKPMSKQRYHSNSQQSQQTITTNQITPGAVINGQCLCACPTISPFAPTSSQSFSSYSTDQFNQKPSTVANIPPQSTSASNGMASTYTGYRGGYYPPQYSQQRTPSSTSSATDSLAAVEMGISDGFGRFFNA